MKEQYPPLVDVDSPRLTPREAEAERELVGMDVESIPVGELPQRIFGTAQGLLKGGHERVIVENKTYSFGERRGGLSLSISEGRQPIRTLFFGRTGRMEKDPDPRYQISGEELRDVLGDLARVTVRGMRKRVGQLIRRD